MDELGPVAALCALPVSNFLLPSPADLGSERTSQTQICLVPSYSLRALSDLTG